MTPELFLPVQSGPTKSINGEAGRTDLVDLEGVGLLLTMFEKLTRPKFCSQIVTVYPPVGQIVCAQPCKNQNLSIFEFWVFYVRLYVLFILH